MSLGNEHQVPEIFKSNAVGPIIAFTRPCGCVKDKQSNPHCQWCMGCGWLTPLVKKLQTTVTEAY